MWIVLSIDYMSSRDLRLKKELISKLESKGRITFGPMFFRHYNELTDHIRIRFSEEDWHKIMGENIEEDIIDLNQCKNVVIYLWCDVLTEIPRGLMFLEEDFRNPGTIIFHGGTCEHERFHYLIFDSLINLLSKLIELGYAISTTCEIQNITADKLQKSLGFVEMTRNESLIFKSLDTSRFYSSTLTKRFLRLPF